MSKADKASSAKAKRKGFRPSPGQADEAVTATQIRVDEVTNDSENLVLDETKSEEENVGPSSKKGRIFGVITAVALLMLIVFNVFWGQDSKELLAQAEASVQSVYLDKDYGYLKDDLTQEDLDQAQQVVRKLKRENRQPYSELLDIAQIKLDSLEQLNTIYLSEQTLINGNKEIPLAQLALRQHATIGVIEVKAQTLVELEQDPMVQSLQLYYQYAIDSLNQIAQVADLVTVLPRGDLTRDDMLEVITLITEVEAKMQPLIQHPQVVALHQELLVFSDLLTQFLVEDVEAGEYDADLIEAMSESEMLSKSLVRTPLGMGPLIALTFDDGPNKTYTPQLLDILAKHEVKATFFVRGDYVDDHPDIAKRIVDDGHLIGNHTYNHPNLSEIPDKDVKNEFELTQTAIQKATGVTPDIYRLPFGVGGKRVIDLMPNMTSILWNVDSADWDTKDVAITYDTIMEDLQYQTLLLMHDTHQAAPELIDLLIPKLKEDGYTFVMPDALEFNMQYFGE